MKGISQLSIIEVLKQRECNFAMQQLFLKISMKTN